MIKKGRPAKPRAEKASERLIFFANIEEGNLIRDLAHHRGVSVSNLIYSIVSHCLFWDRKTGKSLKPDEQKLFLTNAQIPNDREDKSNTQEGRTNG